MPIEVILYAAMSADGFTSTLDGDSDWVSDSARFDEQLRASGCYVVGSNTYKQYLNDLYPIEGLTDIVLSSEPLEGVEVVDSPQAAVDKAAEKGHDAIVVVGGSKTWAAFIQAEIGDRLMIDIEPIMLGSGMRIADDAALQKLELVSSQTTSNGTLEVEYKF